jgi:hypothetical protein
MKYKRLLGTIVVSAVLLAGCGKTVDEQVLEGITTVQAAFEQEPIKANTKENNISLYLPVDYVIDPSKEENNYLINSSDDQYILFINEKEPENSQLNYDLLMKSEDESIVKVEQLQGEKHFGFVAVKQFSEKEYELIVSIGGIKLSTVTNQKKIDEKLANMIDIVRSVEILK